jgi:hypothetical protein
MRPIWSLGMVGDGGDNFGIAREREERLGLGREEGDERVWVGWTRGGARNGPRLVLKLT